MQFEKDFNGLNQGTKHTTKEEEKSEKKSNDIKVVKPK